MGRVIRHRGDHAAIILADGRYLRPSIGAAAATAAAATVAATQPQRPVDKLPGWIRSSLVLPAGSTPESTAPVSVGDFGFMYGRLHAFFRAQRQRQQATAAAAEAK